MKVLFIFIDGLGLGEKDAGCNPLVRFDPPFFHCLFGGPLTEELGSCLDDNTCLVPLDASLGVAGLPQSATGQTSLFTGVNAPGELGRHVQGFPGPALSAIIKEKGILGQLAANGCKVTSANMYVPHYFDLVAKRQRRHSVTTLLTLHAGLSLRSLPDMAAGEAVYHDLTNEMLSKGGFPEVTLTAPAVAGSRLVRLAARNDFTLFEYFQTDRAGHKQDWRWGQIITENLNEFLTAVHDEAPADMLIVITSDHGNFEDFAIKTHTQNAVPGIFLGFRAREAAQGCSDLTDVAPRLTALMRSERND